MSNVRGEYGDQTDEYGNPIHHQTAGGTRGSATGLGAPGTTGAQGTYDPLGAPGTTGAAPTAAGYDPQSYDPGAGGQGQQHRPTGQHATTGREHDRARTHYGVDPAGVTGTTTTRTTTYETTGATDVDPTLGSYGTTTGVVPGTGAFASTGGYDTGGLKSGGGGGGTRTRTGGYDTGGLGSGGVGTGARTGGYDTGGLGSGGVGTGARTGGYDTGGLGSADVGTGDVGELGEGRRHDEKKGVMGRIKDHLPGTGGGGNY